MRLGRFQIFDTGNPGCRKFSDSDRPDLVKLLHLPWRVIPDLSTEAPRKFQRVPNSDGVLEENLTIDHAADQSVNVHEDKILVLLEWKFVFLILFAVWKIHTTQLGLDKERGFVGWKGDVDFYREPDAVGAVDFFIQ